MSTLWLAVLVGLDQLTKFWAERQGWASYNEGWSFGWGSGWLVWLVVSLGLGVVVLCFKKWSVPSWFQVLFLAGASSNLLDRLLNQGLVRDWLVIPFTGLLNNLADWYIFGAVLIYILKYLYEDRHSLRRR